MNLPRPDTLKLIYWICVFAAIGIITLVKKIRRKRREREYFRGMR